MCFIDIYSYLTTSRLIHNNINLLLINLFMLAVLLNYGQAKHQRLITPYTETLKKITIK